MDTTTRWLSMLGIGTLCFGISLFVLRIPIRTIIVFFITGVPLGALWLYFDAKSKQQKKITTVTTQPCICSICKHEDAKSCFQENCAVVVLLSDIPLIITVVRLWGFHHTYLIVYLKERVHTFSKLVI
jgi:hypothetical protein